jgi:hypothetical protein
MFESWFAKQDTSDLPLSGSEKNDNANCRSTRNNENLKRLLGPVQTPPERSGSLRKSSTSPVPPPFEEIYQTAAVKPPKLAYGIQKVAEMSNSIHLAGMSPTSKQKALLMALEAAGSDVGDVLNDVVTRQRALKEYEEDYLSKVSQFESEQAEKNREQKAELDRITGEYKGRLDASLKEIERWQEEFRAWQKSKQLEMQRLSDAAALCVPHERSEDEEEVIGGKVTAIAQRAGGSYR